VSQDILPVLITMMKK